MDQNFRDFQAGPDPFGRTWHVRFLWQQTGISIRHADTIDVKFVLDDGAEKQEKVIALPHPLLLQLTAKLARPLNDAWCLKLAAIHLRDTLLSGEDTEKPLVTLGIADLERANRELDAARAA